MKQVVRLAVAFAALVALPAQAALVSVSGSASTLGDFPEIIAAPGDVRDDAHTNRAQQGFDERQGVTLVSALLVDSGSIAAGTVVDSHMLFLNTEGGTRSENDGVVWTFSGMILGVMSDGRGTLEAASSAVLGSATTIYPGSFRARGLEGGDSYSFAGSSLELDMLVTEPGDWIRVITASAVSVPEPGSLALLGLGLFGLGAMGRRKAA